MRRTMNRSSMMDVDDPQHSLERSPVNAILRQKAIKHPVRPELLEGVWCLFQTEVLSG